MKKAIAIVAVIAIALILSGHNRRRDKPIKYEPYTVHTGDTVSGIAARITPETKDYRDVMYDIIEKNDIKNGLIYPGDILMVPVMEE